MTDVEMSEAYLAPSIHELEARLADIPLAQRIVAGILGDLNPPKKILNDVREAILRELRLQGVM